MSYYIDSVTTGFTRVGDGFFTTTMLDAIEIARHNSIRNGVTTRLYHDNDIIDVFSAGCGCPMSEGECSHIGGN